MDIIHNKQSRREEVAKLLEDLKAAKDTKLSCALHNRVTSMLNHDHWYNIEQRSSVFDAAKASLGLTKKQKLNLPTMLDSD